MPDNPSQKPAGERLFIKVILPKQGMEKKVIGRSGPSIPFRLVDSKFRQSLSSRIQAVEQAIKTPAKKLGAVPARIKLVSKAIAKSHRPENIFSENTCPIVGAGKFGELFISATSQGLEKINQIVTRGTRDKIVKEISTVETIEPITPEYRLGGLTANDVLRYSPKTEDGYVTKVQLFDMNAPDIQAKMVNDFTTECETLKVKISKRSYSNNSYYFEAVCQNASQVDGLSKHVAVRSLKSMPVLRIVQPQVAEISQLPANLPDPTSNIGDYPIVAVVDSGITDQIPKLNQWIAGRHSTVAAAYRNTWHGTFVAGLICWASELNPTLNEIDLTPCKVFDFQVFPNNDPDHGDTEALTEAELLQDLEGALQKFSNEIKVWNISLGTNEVCSLEDFSSFAVELDRLQEQYNVSFVISAGNYRDNPMLDYPRTGDQLTRGRITTPADSVLGIAVGSVCHQEHSKNGPKRGEPSSFSRHGAGPNYIIKPDLVHYGGTCTTDRSETFGVRSISNGTLGESLGTSFSTPIVSRLLANIYHNITPSPSPTLARALMTHHARDPRTGERVPDNEENFIGFGLPSDLRSCIECQSWASTLVFEDNLRPGYFLEWDNFPYPASLQRNGKFFGDIWMTVAFAPHRGQRWGAEYCESHIDAHFGVYYKRKNKKTGAITEEFKGLVPPEHKALGMLHESYLVANLRKWAPVRTYFGSLGTNGVRGDRWRLKVQLLTRHELANNQVAPPQRFALILTIADPEKRAQIYNEMAMSIRTRFQAENLALRPQTKIQVRPGS